MSRIIAFIDSSTYADSVCDHTGWAAERLSLPVSVIHVMGRPKGMNLPMDLTGNMTADGRDSLLNDLVEHEAEEARATQKRARDLLDTAIARARQAGAAEAAPVLRIGDFVDTFEAQAADAELAILGKRGETMDTGKTRLGTNLERAVRASPVPLFIAARAFRPINQVTVGFDGRLSAAKAVDYIARSPLFTDCAITLVTVGKLDKAAQTAREGALKMLSEKGFTPGAVEMSGEPAAAMAEHVEATGTDLLVMGAYGHSRLRSMVIGSTTSEILRACKVPVMLFR